MVSSRRLFLVLALAAGLCLAAPLSASAATTRYASPTGTGASPCVQAEPCSINTAVSFAEGLRNGDTILLAPGTYHPTASVEVFQTVTISGEAGKPAPLIEATGTFGLFVQAGSFAHDIRIHSPSGTFIGLAVETGAVVERIESTGEATRGCSIGEGTIRDSLCVGLPAGGGGAGVSAFLSGPTPFTQQANLFNVTAIGGSEGIVAVANESSTVKIDATNTIASGGGGHDVIARSFVNTAPVAITLSHSNFKTVELEGAEASISSPTESGNQEAAPHFVDEPGGNYRELPDSPTRLTGDLAAVLPGELDLAGNPRTTNCAGTVGVDIGAFQYECPPPPGPPIPPPSEEKKSAPAPPPPVPAVAPQLSKLTLKPKKFTDTGKGPKGTTISYTLDASATVKLEVLGKKTVQGKKKTVTLSTVPGATGKAGPNSVRFSGKLKGKPLVPGKYTLRAVATAAGLSSAPATVGFEVLIP